VFDKKNVNTLLEHRSYDCTINVEEGAQPPFNPIYNLSQDERATLHEYINENFEKGFTQHSKSPIGAPILLSKRRMDLCECVLIFVN
jgi:hypothetical protein